MAGIAVFALTPGGCALARKLAVGLDAQVWLPEREAGPDETGFGQLGPALREGFGQRQGLVVIGAAGLVVRLLAPVLQGKEQDPGVVVLDEAGRFAISLLSGHLGGGNALARRVADLTGGQPVITTASDVVGLPAVDLLAQELGLAMADLSQLRYVAAALLRGERVGVVDEEGRWPSHPPYFERLEARELRRRATGLWIHWRDPGVPLGHALLCPRVLTVGLGCRRGTPKEEILDALTTTVRQQGLALAALAGLASIEAKRDEPGLLAAADALGLPLTFYTAQELAAVEVPNPSAQVAQRMGTASVSEAAARLLSDGGPVLIPKTACGRVTVAVCRHHP